MKTRMVGWFLTVLERMAMSHGIRTLAAPHLSRATSREGAGE